MLGVVSRDIGCIPAAWKNDRGAELILLTDDGIDIDFREKVGNGGCQQRGLLSRRGEWAICFENKALKGENNSPPPFASSPAPLHPLRAGSAGSIGRGKYSHHKNRIAGAYDSAMSGVSLMPWDITPTTYHLPPNS